MVKLSVIMPVYNVETYLDTAIRSVLIQNVDLELLIINDGSTDNSLSIAESYKYDSRVTVISIKNSGLSEARNTGISFASGEFFYFMDSDDALLKDALKELLNKIEMYNLDGISFSYTEYEDEKISKNLESSVGKIKKFDILNTKKALKLLMSTEIHQMAWSYIFKGSIFQQQKIRFSKGRLFEDNNSAPKIFEHADKIGLVQFDKAPYLLRFRKGSITEKNSKKPSKVALDDEYYVFTDAYLTYKRNNINNSDLWYFNKLVHLWIKYQLSTDLGIEKELYSIKSKSRELFSQVKKDLGLRDQWRYARMNISGFDKIIRLLLGENK